MYIHRLAPSTHRPSCTAIVCAYNEERTLGGVLSALLDAPLVDELIAVDDGSQDSTPAVLDQLAHHDRVHAVHFPENRGKGHAMAEAASRAQGKILLFVDADLHNFGPHHVARLLHPLLQGEADMIIGPPTGNKNLLSAVFPLHAISGQRAVFRADFLPLIEPVRTSGYGVETLINLYYRKEGKRVRYVFLDDLFHPIKLQKANPLEAIGQYVHETTQIVQATIRHYPLLLAAYGIGGQ
jgi:glycosyltransferase involved in cell wall biosynthesis